MVQTNASSFVPNDNLDSSSVTKLGAFVNLDTETEGIIPAAKIGGGATSYIQLSSSLQSGATFYVSSGSVDGQVILARTSGNVGIGTSAPGQKLQVQGNILLQASGTPEIRLNNTTGSNTTFRIYNIGDRYVFDDSNNLLFQFSTQTAPSQVMNFTRGQLMVGNDSSPSATIHINTATFATADMFKITGPPIF